MRVDEGNGSPAVERVDTRFGSGRLPEVFQLVVAAVLFWYATAAAVSGVNLLTSICWEGRVYPGCQPDGVTAAFYPLLVAQTLGVVGFVVARRAFRRLGEHVADPTEDRELAPPVLSSAGFWMFVALSVLLVGAAVYAMSFGFLTATFACWNDFGGCKYSDSWFGFAVAVGGEALPIAAFLVARWAFRRRPWRRNAREGPSEM